MYAILSNFKSIQDIISLEKILDLLLFLLLTFLGVAARVSIDIELRGKKLRSIGFFNRYFLATVLAYVLELYLAQHEFLRKYYTELIILFCIFVNDIIEIILKHKLKIFFYLLNALTKGLGDLKNIISKDNDTGDNK